MTDPEEPRVLDARHRFPAPDSDRFLKGSSAVRVYRPDAAGVEVLVATLDPATLRAVPRRGPVAMPRKAAKQWWPERRPMQRRAQ